jgi:16S rRNA G966 N2-methylase RsmD
MQSMNVLKKIYPLPNNNNYSNLSYDMEGLWSITHPYEADIISNNIIILLDNHNMKKDSIIDMTAGCGGNTLSFIKYFNNVTAVEMNEDRFKILQGNIKSYDINNIELICGDSINNINNTYDVFFIDPPWGGPDYKKYTNITLMLSNIMLIDIINMIPINKMIVLKLPFNYDMGEILCKYKLLLKLEIKNFLIYYIVN